MYTPLILIFILLKIDFTLCSYGFDSTIKHLGHAPSAIEPILNYISQWCLFVLSISNQFFNSLHEIYSPLFNVDSFLGEKYLNLAK